MSIKAIALIAAAIFMLMAGILQNVGQIYFMAAVVTAVALVAWFAVSVSLRGLQLQRKVMDRVLEEEMVTVQLTVSNPTRFPKFFLALEEKLSPWLETDQTRFFIPVLWPGEKAELEYRCRARKRGRLRLGPVEMTSSDPIGLLYRDITLQKTDSALVYPRPIEMPPHDFEGATSFGGGMAERTARTGEGLDFHGVREYQPGDELRRIHWKSFAHQQQLAVIEFEQAYTSDIAIGLDLLQGTEVGAGKQTTLECGVKIAASLARRALDNRASVTLGLQGASGLQLIACRREEDLFHILEALAEAKADGEVPIYSLANAMRAQLFPGSALVLITSDSDSRLADLAGLLRAENIKLTTVLLDASTFAAGQKTAAAVQQEDGAAAELSDAAGTEAQTPAKPRAGHAYTSLAESLRRLGANAHIVGQEADLTTAIRRIAGGAE